MKTYLCFMLNMITLHFMDFQRDLSIRVLMLNSWLASDLKLKSYSNVQALHQADPSPCETLQHNRTSTQGRWED